MTTRRDALKLGGAALGAMALPVLAEENIRYMGASYQAWTPMAPYDYVTFIQRFDSPTHRERGEYSIVGVALHGGPWQFISDAEAKRHVQAIADAAEVESQNVRNRHANGAEKSIALHNSMNLPHDADMIRAHHKLKAEERLAIYRGHIRQIVEDRKAMLGMSHPMLAIELYRRVMSEIGITLA